MKIAVIGAGISGLVTARLLRRQHEVDVFEANDYIGGHTHTVDVRAGQSTVPVDTGFIVFNDRTYPNFERLLDELGVRSVPTSMSFSVRSDPESLEYNGTSLNGLFGQRRNLFRPRFYRMLSDVLRFNREAPTFLDGARDEELTVGDYLGQFGYGRDFADLYLLPMGAAIWSCPTTTFENFPIAFIIEFYLNHGLLSLRDRPTWRVVEGGSRVYVECLTDGWRDRIHLDSPIRSVIRADDRVEVRTDSATAEYDEIIFACHSDQALAILGESATGTERELLGAFPYEANTAVLHTDRSVLPRRRRCWASWNYHIHGSTAPKVTVTYLMNQLQHLQTQETYCVTLNDTDQVDPERIIDRFLYSHPIYTTRRAAIQRRHREVIRVNRTSFCGAYWGNGFHEDGVNSALRVCEAYGEGLTTSQDAGSAQASVRTDRFPPGEGA